VFACCMSLCVACVCVLGVSVCGVCERPRMSVCLWLQSCLLRYCRHMCVCRSRVFLCCMCFCVGCDCVWGISESVCLCVCVCVVAELSVETLQVYVSLCVACISVLHVEIFESQIATKCDIRHDCRTDFGESLP